MLKRLLLDQNRGSYPLAIKTDNFSVLFYTHQRTLYNTEIVENRENVSTMAIKKQWVISVWLYWHFLAVVLAFFKAREGKEEAQSYGILSC